MRSRSSAASRLHARRCRFQRLSLTLDSLLVAGEAARRHELRDRLAVDRCGAQEISIGKRDLVEVVERDAHLGELV
jgi:hypothetical protein